MSMTGGGATRSFQAVLAEIHDVHEQELKSMREQFDKKLKELYKENAHCRSLLAWAHEQIVRLDPQASPTAPEWTAEPNRNGAEAGNGAKGSVGLDPSPDVGTVTAVGAQPEVTSSAAPVEGTANAMLRDTTPATANPAEASCKGPRWVWEVVGGENHGGILVRESQQIDSQSFCSRLAKGSIVEETERNGDRLKFKRITGAGPKSGWISTKASGRDLVVRVDRPPLRPWQPPPVAVGPRGEPPLSTVLVFKESRIPRNALGMHKELEVVKEALSTIAQNTRTDMFMLDPAKAWAWQSIMAYFVAGLAALARLRSQRPDVVMRAGAIAGVGAGQYIALCAAGVISLEDGLNLVKARAAAQVKASSLCSQRTMSVASIDQNQLHLFCLQACRQEGPSAICHISAYLTHRYFWVSGTGKAMDLVEGMAREAGGQVLRMFPSAPHTSLMTTAQAELTAALEEALPRMKPPLYTAWMNSTGEPIRPGCDPAGIVADLKKELCSPMLTAQCIDAMRKEGISEFFDVCLTTDRYEPIRPKAAGDWMDPWGLQAGSSNTIGPWGPLRT